MKMECVSNFGFEDKLTLNAIYSILDRRGCSVLVKDNDGEETWFGCVKFRYVGETE